MTTEKSTTIKNLSFQITKISNGNNRVIRPGITVNITLDAYNADKELIKKSLQQIFTEIIIYMTFSRLYLSKRFYFHIYIELFYRNFI